MVQNVLLKSKTWQHLPHLAKLEAWNLMLHYSCIKNGPAHFFEVDTLLKILNERVKEINDVAKKSNRKFNQKPLLI